MALSVRGWRELIHVVGVEFVDGWRELVNVGRELEGRRRQLRPLASLMVDKNIHKIVLVVNWSDQCWVFQAGNWQFFFFTVFDMTNEIKYTKSVLPAQSWVSLAESWHRCRPPLPPSGSCPWSGWTSGRSPTLTRLSSLFGSLAWENEDWIFTYVV